MIVCTDHDQGTHAWFQARLGIPTSSVFSKIVTSQGKKSDQWTKCLYGLVAERLRGKPEEEGYRSKWMDRGNIVEPQAVLEYELITGSTVETVGLCYPNDKKDSGFSPDGLVDDRTGGLETKCPSPGVQVERLLKKVLPSVYRPQVWGSLYLSGLEWWDFVSYHPGMDTLIIRTTPDDKGYQIYKNALIAYLPMFIAEIESITKKLGKS